MENNGLVASPIQNTVNGFFRHGSTQTKGIAAEVNKTCLDTYNGNLTRKNVVTTLNKENCNQSTYLNIITKGINRLRVIGFEPELCEMLRKLDHIENIYIENDCIGYFQMNLFQNLPNLRSLNLSGCLVNDDCFRIISLYLLSLEELNLSNCSNHVTDNSLLILSSGLKKLHILHLNGKFLRPMNSISDDGIRYLTGYHHKGLGIPSLEYLNLSHIWSLTDDSLKYIGQRLVNLVSLDLSTSENISNVGLRYLINLEKLKSLSLAYCSEISDDGLEILTQLKNLNSLSLKSCKLITDNGLEYISQLKNLNHLDLSQCTLITDISLKHISQLKNLNNLDLSYCNLITHIGLKSFSLLMNLKYLSLGYCTGITDGGLKELSTLPTLQTLNFRGCHISSKGLGNLADGIMKLTELDLSSCYNVGDIGLKYISESSFKTSLLNLCLDNCKISDAGINYILEGCLNIQNFSVKFCPNVTMKAIKRICQSDSE